MTSSVFSLPVVSSDLIAAQHRALGVLRTSEYASLNQHEKNVKGFFGGSCAIQRSWSRYIEVLYELKRDFSEPKVN